MSISFIQWIKNQLISLFFNLGYLFWQSLTLVTLKTFFNFKIEGKENLPKNGPMIFAANHQNFADGIFIALLYPCTKKINFIITKRALNFLFSWLVCKTLNTNILYGKNEYFKALKSLSNILLQGGMVGIFPEGDISKRSIPFRFKPGVAKLSIDTKTDVVPIYINGSYEMRNLDYWFKKSEVILKIGKPIQLYNHLSECNNDLDQLAEYLRKKVVELSGLKELVKIEENVINESKLFLDKANKKEFESKVSLIIR